MKTGNGGVGNDGTATVTGTAHEGKRLPEGGNKMKYAKLLFVVVGIFALQGCTTALLAVGGTAAQAGIYHHMNSISQRTFANPISETKSATLATLARLDMDVRSVDQTEMGWKITAHARGRTITIDLDGLTPNATRMEVAANRFLFVMDKATAAAIVSETSHSLVVLAQARELAQRVTFGTNWQAKVSADARPKVEISAR